MRKVTQIVLTAVGCLLLLQPGQPVRAQLDPASEVILLVNNLRAAYGLPPYQVDNILMAVAQAQASWSAANNHIGHDGPGSSLPNERALAAGYGGGHPARATENAAHGTASLNTPSLVVGMWQSDEGHLSAMISPDYQHIGVGYAEAGGFSWYVMMAGWVDADQPQDYDPGGSLPAGYGVMAPVLTSTADAYGAVYHEVQAGQTAWTIAASYGIGLDELLFNNNLTEDAILHAGDVLLVKQIDRPTSTPDMQAASAPTITMQAAPTALPASVEETDGALLSSRRMVGGVVMMVSIFALLVSIYIASRSK